MEDSHRSARVKREGDFLSILAHIQELSSPREILSVLLRRTVESYGFLSGWFSIFEEGEWHLVDSYPPLEAQRETSLLSLLSSLEEGKGARTLTRKDHFFVVVPVRTRWALRGALILKGSSRPGEDLLRILEILGVATGGCMTRCEKHISRLKGLSFLVKAERRGRNLLMLEDLSEIEELVEKDCRELVECQGVLLALVEENEIRFLKPVGEEMKSLARRILSSKKEIFWEGKGLFPLLWEDKVRGLLLLEGTEDLLKKQGKKGVLDIYTSSLAQSIHRAMETRLLKERYKGIVTSPLLCLFQVDPEGRISFINGSLALTLGYPLREARGLVGKPFHQLVHPSHQAMIMEKLKAQMKEEGGPEIHQITMSDKEGSPVPMMVSTVSIAHPVKGQGILGVAIDVTEKERLLEDLSRRNKELESFAYSAAHELRGPIVYLKRVVSQPSLDDFPMEELKWAVNRLESTLKHLTAYSLMDNKEVELKRISPYLLVEGIWRDLAREVGITMDIAIKLPPVIKSDPFLLELIFRNLLRNAFKYGIKGSPPLVEVGYTRKKGELLFYVKDYGEGFPPEKAQEIFEPFVRLHPSKKGTGLGLTIAKKAVEKLGGKIWAEGFPGKGATFYFTHPIL